MQKDFLDFFISWPLIFELQLFLIGFALLNKKMQELDKSLVVISILVTSLVLKLLLCFVFDLPTPTLLLLFQLLAAWILFFLYRQGAIQKPISMNLMLLLAWLLAALYFRSASKQEVYSASIERQGQNMIFSFQDLGASLTLQSEKLQLLTENQAEVEFEYRFYYGRLKDLRIVKINQWQTDLVLEKNFPLFESLPFLYLGGR